MTAAVARHLPFGLSRVVPPTLVGYVLINSCMFGVDLGTLTLLHGGLHWPLPLAVTLSYFVVFSLSFVLNRHFNFASRTGLGRQTGLYVVAVGINYVVNILGVVDGLVALGLDYQLARFLAALCEAAFMYSALRWVVFRDGGLAPVPTDTSVPPEEPVADTTTLRR